MDERQDEDEDEKERDEEKRTGETPPSPNVASPSRKLTTG